MVPPGEKSGGSKPKQGKGPPPTLASVPFVNAAFKAQRVELLEVVAKAKKEAKKEAKQVEAKLEVKEDFKKALKASEDENKALKAQVDALTTTTVSPYSIS